MFKEAIMSSDPKHEHGTDGIENDTEKFVNVGEVSEKMSEKKKADAIR